MRTVGHIVADIQKCESENDAITRYKKEATEKGLSVQWIRSAFRGKRPLPVLDLEYNVHGTGVNVLKAMGVPEATQTLMWENWALLADDIKASWVQDFKKLDPSHMQDVFTYTQLLVDMLTKTDIYHGGT